MSNKLSYPTNSCYGMLFRTSVIIFGCVAVGWGLMIFPVFWHASLPERTAERVIAGEPFKIEVLTKQIPTMESVEKSKYCYPADIRSAAIIRLRIVEAMISAGEQDKVDAQMKSLGTSIVKSLSCLPADPFLWLALYSRESRSGSAANQFKYLRLSYQLGPNEGWIGLRRNSISLTNFERLPPDLKEAAISEFVGLLNSGFYREMATIFAGPGWPLQELILPRLKAVDQKYRQAFVNTLYRQGFDVTVPDTTRPEYQPKYNIRRPL